ncbi:low affinity iron permease family protein [Pseudobdellovibrio sp. HCB154]|uniref:low affinity iron permease family protein n=1 Tax=Pseudobdellovibrio sp. HCB154 TaxID=3386277 RepID=UPI003916E694
MEKKTLFTRFSKAAANFSGKPLTFGLAIFIILAWLISGPFFDFSDTWQLIINTSTTIITFLMVFLIQSTQNRDTAAIQIKLDELIRATQGAHNALLDLEELEDSEISKLRENYEMLAEKARKDLKAGKVDTEMPDIKN